VTVALSAPPEVQAKLLDMADYDRALNRARTTQAALADSLHIPSLSAAVDELKGRRLEAFVELEGIRSELARAESDVAMVDKRIATDKERLEHTASAKDSQGLEHELGSLMGRRSDLEDIELAIMERLTLILELRPHSSHLGLLFDLQLEIFHRSKARDIIDRDRLPLHILHKDLEHLAQLCGICSEYPMALLRRIRRACAGICRARRRAKIQDF
jgi:hypothetical protein